MPFEIIGINWYRSNVCLTPYSWLNRGIRCLIYWTLPYLVGGSLEKKRQAPNWQPVYYVFFSPQCIFVRLNYYF
jgi:hypothetical protein